MTGLLPDPVFLDFQLAQGNTPDVAGPYTVQVRADNVNEVLLTYRVDDGSERVVTMSQVAAGIFEAHIPGQPVGTRIEYQITGLGDEGAQASFPPIWEGFDIIELTGSPAAYVALRQEDALRVKAHFQLKQSQARVNVSARHRELFNTELGLYGLPEHRQMTVTFDPTQTWFDVEQCRGYPTVAL